MIGAFVTFTSCKDYDDDINNLEQKIGALSSTLNELKAKVDAGAVITDVTSTPDGVKVTLSDGKTFELTNGKDGVDGQNGKDGKDGEPGSVVTIGENGNWFIDGVDTELPAQGPKGEQGEQGPVGPEGPEGPVGPEGPAGKDGVYYVPNEDGYWYKHDGDEVTKGDLWLLPGVITAVMHDNGDVTFHNVQAGNDTNTFTVYNNKLLRSLVLIPHHYVNGVEAIGFNPLAYLCGGFDCISGEYDELYGWYGQGNEGGWGRSVATRATGEECEIYRANPKSVKVQYFVNPSTITADMIDTENLSFVYKYQENKLRSEDINATATFESLEDGILTVVVDLDANYAEEPGKWDWHQRIDKMDMIALQVPLSEKAANYAPNVEPVITSDWARVDVEDLAWPVIDRKETLCEVDHIDYTFAYPTADAAKAMDDDDTPYMLELVYDKKHDLLDYVTSTALTVDECDEFDPAEYGLVWNFDLLDENGDEIVYKLTSNATDQQEFIKLLDNQGKLEARVYDADEGDGVTDAIGRTPIVRMQLIDPKTECVVTEGFVKIKWVKEHPVFDAEYPAEDVDFSCEMLETEAGYYSAMGIDIKTPWMNTNVMNKIGSYYQEFIEVYDLDTDALYDEDGEELDWGVVVSNLDDDSGDSEVTDLFSVYLKDVCDLTENTTFEGYVHYTHHVTGEVAVRVKVTINVVMPQLSVAGHNNTYWKDGTNTSNVFMVNPVQFGTDSQVNPTANYRTDLLNGFTDGTTYTDDISKIVKSSIKGHVPCDVKFVFDAEALKSYTYDVEGVTYKSTGTNPNLRVSANGKNLEFNNNGTWTIGAYIKDYNPMPGLTHGGSAIHLSESGQEGNAVLDSWPHKFAKALVGEHVPVKLTADLCCGIECDLSRTIRAFEVYFIPPMHINSKFTDSFVDWVVKGDYISLDKAFTLTDFAGYLVANTADWTGTPANTPEKERYTKSLWDYYELHNVVWDVANATCNIDAVNGDIDVVPGANKPLPVNYEVSYVNTTQNPNSLRFQNNSGAPLAKEFELYVPVTVGHKWGTLKTTVTIKVLPAP